MGMMLKDRIVVHRIRRDPKRRHRPSLLRPERSSLCGLHRRLDTGLTVPHKATSCLNCAAVKQANDSGRAILDNAAYLERLFVTAYVGVQEMGVRFCNLKTVHLISDRGWPNTLCGLGYYYKVMGCNTGLRTPHRSHKAATCGRCWAISDSKLKEAKPWVLEKQDKKQVILCIRGFIETVDQEKRYPVVGYVDGAG